MLGSQPTLALVGGLDECAWLLSTILRANRALNHVKHTWVAFIDGESAFCRPPRSIILRALRRIPMGDNEWLGIGSLLGSLRGTLKLGHILFGSWLEESCLPQGGLPSMDLFCATIIELEEELRSCGCGIVLVDSHGQPHRIALLAFVDDLVLFANSAAELQRALDIVAKWA